MKWVTKALLDELSTTFSHAFEASNAAESIRAYDDFLSSLQSYVVNTDSLRGEPNDDYYTIEQFAVSRLSRLVEEQGAVEAGYTSSPLFDSIHNSAVICNSDGVISAANKQAQYTHGLTREMRLTSLNLALQTGEDFCDKLKTCLRQTGEESRLSLIQGTTKSSDTLLTIAILRLDDHPAPTAQALVIFFDTACSTESLSVFASRFGLTRAETDIAASFAKGHALRDIAKTRHRSYTTVRNQFQAILNKTGCSNQTELLRTLLNVSWLLCYTEVMGADSPRAYKEPGRKVIVMRPGGRYVDVRLYGDPKGTPFVLLPSLFGMPMTSAIERALWDHSMLMIGIWRPGFSETSEPLDDEDSCQCLAADISAVLDNQGIQQCPLLGRASAARSVFNMARLIPHRISGAAIVNSLVPLPWLGQHKIISKWGKALMSAAQYSPKLAALILQTGKKMMMRHGARHYFQQLFRSSACDIKVILDGEIAASLYDGSMLCATQGLSSPAQDVIDGFSDWSADVMTAKTRVSLLHGRSDPNVPIKAVRQFAVDNPQQVELIEFADGGGLLSYTHVDAILDWVSSKAPRHNGGADISCTETPRE